MLSQHNVRKVTGSKAITSYFKSISSHRYEAQSRLQFILEEEKSEQRRMETEERIEEREKLRKERIIDQQRLRRQANKISSSNNNNDDIIVNAAETIRRGIDSEEIVVVDLSNASSNMDVTSKKRKKQWKHRPENWMVIAEYAKAFGDDAAIRDFSTALKDYSPSAMEMFFHTN